APVVKAASSGPDILVEVEQAKHVPGTAIITLTDNITVEKNSYYVNFGIESVDDEFNNSTLGKTWSWIRENSEDWSLSEKSGSLTITAKDGGLKEASNNAENILLQSANTDWVIESKLVFSRKPTGFSQHGGLIAYQDDDNYVKLVYGAGGGFRRRDNNTSGSVFLIIEENGNEGVTACEGIPDPRMLFFMRMRGGQQQAAPQIPFEMSVDYFHIQNSGAK
ncbi:MAG: hypothetical protein P8X42_18030, partial [Calditrichaceae bacterium]